MVKKRRSPQEKKRLSYSKDRRNSYGENDKSSRRNIARNKRFRHRSDRHRAQQQLTTGRGPVDDVVETGIDELVTRTRRGSRWRKFPDVQLGLFVVGTLEWRVKKGISEAGTERARIEKVRRRTEVDDWLPRQS